MTPNIKVQNFLTKHRSNITLAAHTDRMLFSELERLFQEMYDLGMLMVGQKRGQK